MNKTTGTLKRNASSALLRAPVTAENTFASCNPERDYLFAVRPGVSASDALSEASCVLFMVKAELDSAAMGDSVISQNQAWLLFKAIESAKAVVDAVHLGLDDVAV
jgi:hypothetical protein